MQQAYISPGTARILTSHSEKILVVKIDMVARPISHESSLFEITLPISGHWKQTVMTKYSNKDLPRKVVFIYLFIFDMVLGDSSNHQAGSPSAQMIVSGKYMIQYIYILRSLAHVTNHYFLKIKDPWGKQCPRWGCQTRRTTKKKWEKPRSRRSPQRKGKARRRNERKEKAGGVLGE